MVKLEGSGEAALYTEPIPSPTWALINAHITAGKIVDARTILTRHSHQASAGLGRRKTHELMY